MNHENEFFPGWDRSEPVIWAPFFGDRLALMKGVRNGLPVSEKPPFPIAESSFPNIAGDWNGMLCIAYAAAGECDMGRYDLVELRQSYDLLDLDLYRIASTGAELNFFDATSRFCSVCGGATKVTGPIVRTCTKCGREIFPSVHPAVIVLVRKGEQALLVRARNFKRAHYGLVAGFVEPGESCEEAVVRELMEETAIRVKNIRYFGNQEWPFPSGLMVAFTADYESGEIRIQESELLDAQFFDRDNVPPLPLKLSIARKLIDSWMNERRR